ncbi:hypothetical protein ACH4L5_13310 [Streptomyces sp. NPDC017405]|uniref:hypothetical protein n=1 Tax=unclassified Streptomyces TaxID=2593676 RepID=UPI0037A3E6EF
MRAIAELIRSPFPDPDWSPEAPSRCMVEDVPHDFHAAWLRTGSTVHSDLFLCWRDGSPDQWIADFVCCMNRRTELSTGCTIFKYHPGKCEWAYVDPERVAVQAQADQLAQKLNLPHVRADRNAPPHEQPEEP